MGQLALGVVFLPQLPPDRLLATARVADEAGLEELWLWEDCFRESGVASAAAALAVTQRLRVGVGLLPAPLRNVALTAMEVANLSRMFPDRCLVGVGHGVQEWMGQVGARVESPLTLLREYLTALRELLRGQTVSTQGRYVRLDDVTLDWPPQRVPPVFGGGVGPRTLALCGELADGTLLTAGTTPGQVGRVRTAVSRQHILVVYVMAAIGAGAEARLASEFERWPIDPSPDTGIAGDAEAIAAAVQRWVNAGADTVVLQPTLEEDLDDFIRVVAREVRPAVSPRR